MAESGDNEDEGVLGVDLPNYGAAAVAAQRRGLPIPPPPGATFTVEQVGGTHYGKLVYAHWDWISDANLPYLLGCATKYPVRWRDKGGVEDLEKAISYVNKAHETETYARTRVGLEQFATQLPADEANIVRQIIYGNYTYAVSMLRQLISTENLNID